MRDPSRIKTKEKPMPRKQGTSSWESIRERAEKGEFTLVDPLDYLVLKVLHPEGTMFAGVYPLGHTVKQINNEAFEGKIPNTHLSPRIGSLHAQGLVEAAVTVGTGGSKVWQRTVRGTQVLETWLKTQAKDDSNG